MPNQDFKLKISIYYLIAMIIFLLCTLIIAMQLALPWYGRLLLAVSSSIALIVAIYRYGTLQAANSITALRYSGQYGWQAKTSHQAFPATISGSSYLSQMLMVLHLKNSINQKVHLAIILPDSLTKNEYKRLQQLLNYR